MEKINKIKRKSSSNKISESFSWQEKAVSRGNKIRNKIKSTANPNNEIHNTMYLWGIALNTK